MKNYPLAPDKYFSTCAVLQDASASALFERARSGTRIKTTNCLKRVTRKRPRRVEVFYRNLKCGVRLKAEKIRKKIPENMDQ